MYEFVYGKSNRQIERFRRNIREAATITYEKSTLQSFVIFMYQTKLCMYLHLKDIILFYPSCELVIHDENTFFYYL